ncbi:hypothetical protein NMG60_11013331 [Bertholletia excelsa]
MSIAHSTIPFLFIFFVLLPHCSHGDIGTAAQYGPFYVPTACYGNDPSQFPSSNLFGAAGEGIWDNGAACGRQYMVRCISATAPYTCDPEQTIQIRIVDYAPSAQSPASTSGTTMVLSMTALSAVANSSAQFINIEFQQWHNVRLTHHCLTCFNQFASSAHVFG